MSRNRIDDPSRFTSELEHLLRDRGIDRIEGGAVLVEVIKGMERETGRQADDDRMLTRAQPNLGGG
jgi:hypothetical protein